VYTDFSLSKLEGFLAPPANNDKLRFEVPSNIVLKLMRPSVWISVLLFGWGLVMTLMGVVKSYEGLVAARFFLGVAEAGFFPASTCAYGTFHVKRVEPLTNRPNKVPPNDLVQTI